MTHFFIQLTVRNNSIRRDTIEKRFLGDFKQTKFLKEQKCVIFSADFIQNNFILEKKDKVVRFQINLVKGLSISKSSNEKQINYSPEITINTDKDEVMIKTDPSGTDLIYFSILDNGDLVIASHLKYIIALHPKLLNELDYKALVEYLFCHSTLGTKTLFKNIKLLPGNSKITISNWMKNPKKAFERGLNEKQSWFEFPKDYQKGVDIHKTARDISVYLENQMKNYSEIEDIKLAFLLSGGLDSRILVSAIDKKWMKKVETYTFDSLLDGKEIKYATGVSDILGVPHKYRVVSEDDILTYCYKHMWFSEGLSNHVISIRHALYEKVKGDKVFFDGFLGDGSLGGNYLIHNERIVRKFDSPEERLMENLIVKEYGFPKKHFFSIIANSKEEITNILIQGMKEQRNLLHTIENELLEQEILLTQTRARGYMLGGSRSFSHLAPIYLPLSHPEIYAKYLQVEPKLRKKRKLEMLILNSLNKELAEYPTTSLIWYNRLFFTKFVKLGFKSLQFLESLFRSRIILRYSSVPYFEWLRKRNHYYNFVLDILSDDAIIWNILDRENTMKFFHNFIKRKNHMHKFILHIVDLEIILRLFFALKEDDEKIVLVNDSNKKYKEFKLKPSLEYLKDIVRKQ
ncbi:MAG: hypothetical protein KGD59_02120 [Candidatus Heimdallarchaeota archaeon]|nr:hypothetical protein [Candidatus Heimdallarchaeota archaeon]MBY8993317.1 hypothetical protein [Candidatus Heimdallarchaeota archaeon]